MIKISLIFRISLCISFDRGHPDAMCSQLGVLQLACAALEALDHKGNHHRDKIYATEKVSLYQPS